MGYTYDRTASAPSGSLMAAKLAWAKGLAEVMARRFTSYGGWREFKCQTDIKVYDFVELTVKSATYGWNASVSIYCHKAPGVIAYIDVSGKPAGADTNLLDMLQDIDQQTLKFDVEDYDTAEDTTMKVSLWFSKHLNKLLNSKPGE